GTERTEPVRMRSVAAQPERRATARTVVATGPKRRPAPPSVVPVFIEIRLRLQPSFPAEKYSVNPNGSLKTAPASPSRRTFHACRIPARRFPFLAAGPPG